MKLVHTDKSKIIMLIVGLFINLSWSVFLIVDKQYTLGIVFIVLVVISLFLLQRFSKVLWVFDSSGREVTIKKNNQIVFRGSPIDIVSLDVTRNYFYVWHRLSKLPLCIPKSIDNIELQKLIGKHKIA